MSENMHGGSSGGPFGGRRRGGLFDDIAGVAGGAFSALAGLRAEVEAMARSQVEMLVQRLDLVRRDDLDAAMEVASRARADAEAAREALAALEARLAALERRNAAPVPPVTGQAGPAAGDSAQERAEASSSGAPGAAQPQAPAPRGPLVSPDADASGDGFGGATVSEGGPIEPGTPSPQPGASPLPDSGGAPKQGRPAG